MIKRYTTASGVISAFRRSFRFDEIIPQAGDIAAVASFTSVIFDTPIDEEVTAASFDEAVAALPEYVGEWKAAVDRTLVEKLHTGATVADLHLAKTVFSCSVCKQAVQYRGAVFHDCAHSRIYNVPGRTRQLHASIASVPWTTNDYTFSSARSEAAIQLMTLCGLDPDTTTTREFEECDRVLKIKYSYNAAQDGFVRGPAGVGFQFLQFLHFNTPRSHGEAAILLNSQMLKNFNGSKKRKAQIQTIGSNQCSCTRVPTLKLAVVIAMKEVIRRRL
jgi:hypothetical protein